MAPLLGMDPERELPRLLPKDHKVRAATADCRRSAELALAAVAEYERAWTADPPDFDGGREAIRKLRLAIDDLRGAARDLEVVTRPIK
ncbi:MAG TPA: hypothetical protein VFF67_03135 [Thermoplasmata archaeon]|nr:hypothetical protein [Thermoplasmata archaeon]